MRVHSGRGAGLEDVLVDQRHEIAGGKAAVSGLELGGVGVLGGDGRQRDIGLTPTNPVLEPAGVGHSEEERPVKADEASPVVGPCRGMRQRVDQIFWSLSGHR